MVELRNGEVWEAPWPVCHVAITQWVTDDHWLLLSAPSPAAHGGSCMVAHDGRGYTKAELTARLESEGWKKTDYFTQCNGWPVCRHDDEAEPLERYTSPKERKE